jgi:RecJ-like exonuclease
LSNIRECSDCDGQGWNLHTKASCQKCRGSGKAASMLDVTNVGEFRCHMCRDSDAADENLQPCTVKIGVLVQLSCYLCKECQLKLAGIVKAHVSIAPPPPQGDVDRNIIL